MAARRVGAKERPPASAPLRIGARFELSTPWGEPCRRAGWQLLQWRVGGVVRPQHRRHRPAFACHARTASPRSNGRSIRRSTRPSAFAAFHRPEIIACVAPSRGGETMNASLHPLFTPRIGRPRRVRASGVPAAASRSNAARASGGSRSHGAPGESSSAMRARAIFHSSALVAMMHRDANDFVLVLIVHPSSSPRFRASRNDGYTAASNAARDSAQSSIAQQLRRDRRARGARRRLRATAKVSREGAARTFPRGTRRARSIAPRTDAARSTCAEKPRPAPVSSAPGIHAASRNERYRARNASRVASGMLCSLTHGRVSRDEIESAIRGGVGEMNRK